MSKAKDNFGESAEDDYLVDHSIIFYLNDPEGNFVTFYGTSYDDVGDLMLSILPVLNMDLAMTCC